MCEMAAQLQAGDFDLALEWIPREQNEEADALSNGDFSSFDLGRRMEIDVPSLRFLVLDRMLGVAEHLYAETKAAKAKRKQEEEDGTHQEVKKVRPHDRLKARDPW